MIFHMQLRHLNDVYGCFSWSSGCKELPGLTLYTQVSCSLLLALSSSRVSLSHPAFLPFAQQVSNKDRAAVLPRTNLCARRFYLIGQLPGQTNSLCCLPTLTFPSSPTLHESCTPTDTHPHTHPQSPELYGNRPSQLFLFTLQMNETDRCSTCLNSSQNTQTGGVYVRCRVCAHACGNMCVSIFSGWLLEVYGCIFDSKVQWQVAWLHCLCLLPLRPPPQLCCLLLSSFLACQLSLFTLSNLI